MPGLFRDASGRREALSSAAGGTLRKPSRLVWRRVSVPLEFELSEQRRVKKVEVDRRSERVLLDDGRRKSVCGRACLRRSAVRSPRRYSCGRRRKKERALEADPGVRRLHHHQPVDLLRRRELLGMPDAGRAQERVLVRAASSRSSARSNRRLPKNGTSMRRFDFVVAVLLSQVDFEGAVRDEEHVLARAAAAARPSSQNLRKRPELDARRRRSRARTGCSSAAKCSTYVRSRPLAVTTRLRRPCSARAVGDFERRVASDRTERQARPIVARRARGRRTPKSPPRHSTRIFPPMRCHTAGAYIANRTMPSSVTVRAQLSAVADGAASKIEMPPLPAGNAGSRYGKSVPAAVTSSVTMKQRRHHEGADLAPFARGSPQTGQRGQRKQRHHKEPRRANRHVHREGRDGHRDIECQHQPPLRRARVASRALPVHRRSASPQKQRRAHPVSRARRCPPAVRTD